MPPSFSRRASAVAFVASIAVAPVALRAQVPGDVVRLRVLPEGGTRAPRYEWVGTLERMDADSVVLRIGAARRQALARDVVQHVWVRREARSGTAGALRWGIPSALLGVVVGAAVGASTSGAKYCPAGAAYDAGDCTGGGAEPVAVGAAAGGLVFGVVGGAIGRSHGRFRWSSVDTQRGAALEVTPARVGFAIPLR
jgi:hypothetical protein